jgi:hypothetical protein
MDDDFFFHRFFVGLCSNLLVFFYVLIIRVRCFVLPFRF